MNDNGARGSDDPILKITLLEHELDEAQRENLRLRQTLLEPPYSQLRSVIRQYPHVSKTAIKALNVVTGTGRINFHRRAFARLQFPRDLREMQGSGLFDAAWYKANYSDVSRSGMDPLRHYALIGAAEGFDPGPRFSTDFYLEHNPDVSRGTNALLHYLRHGRPRGSKIAPSTVERQWLTLTLDERFPNLRPLHVYASASAPKRISMVTDSINSGSLFGGSLLGCSLFRNRLLRDTLGPDPRLREIGEVRGSLGWLRIGLRGDLLGVDRRHRGGRRGVRCRLGRDVVVDDVGPDDGRSHRRQYIHGNF